MLTGLKFRLVMNKLESELLSKHVGCYRFVYNYYLDQKIQHYNKFNETLPTNECINDLPNLKDEYSWLREVDSTSLQQSLRNLDTSYKNFFKSGFGFPKFKSKKTSRQSFRITNVNNNIRVSNNKIKVGKVGFLRVFKGKKRLTSRLPKIYDIKSATISRDSDQHWYISLTIECENQTSLKLNNNIVGIDLGISNNYTVHYNIGSEYHTDAIDNPKSFQKAEKSLKKRHRELSRKQKCSRNREKSRIYLAKSYFKVKSIRENFNHQLSRSLIDTFQMIVIEDLDLAEMKEHRLGKQVSDLAFYQFRTFLSYKAERFGRNISIVDRYFSSSKLCSNCRTKNPTLQITDRTWTCPSCNTHLNRDINAATNLWQAGVISWNTGNYNIDDQIYQFN